MKYKLTLAALLCTILSISYSQYNPDIFTFRKDWSAARNIDAAAYIVLGSKDNDTTYTCRYYTRSGPMMKWETYRDETMKMPNGRFIWYNEKGKIDSMGMVADKRKDKTWEYAFDDNLRPGLTEEYDNGKLVKRTDHRTKMITYADGSTEPLEKPKPKDTTAVEKTITITQTAASFANGGVPGWVNYLSGNMKTPDTFMRNSKAGTNARVYVQFTIDTEGALGNIVILNSCEWSVDTESIRVLMASPPWTAALQNGKKVMYRHRQSLTYAVQ